MSARTGQRRRGPRRRQRGFSAILMIALVVLVAGMLGYAVTVTGAMHDSAAREIASSRAAQAAQSGLEWAQFRVRAGVAPTCAPGSNITLPYSSGAIPVTVTCAATAFTEAGAPVTRYRFTATACRPAAAGTCPNPAGGADYVEAQVLGSAER